MTRIFKSDAQANAEALARRSSTYADDHGRTWEARFNRGTEPRTLRELVIDLRRAYADEVPSKLHEGPDQVDGGGTPAFAPAFQAYLYGSPMAVDRRDEGGTVEVRMSPVRAALENMGQSDATKAQIVRRVLLGASPEDAVGLPLEPWMAKAIAECSLRVFWRRCSAVRLDLGRTESAA